MTNDLVKPAWDTYTEYGEGEIVPLKRIERRPFHSQEASTRAGQASTASSQAAPARIASTASIMKQPQPKIVTVPSPSNLHTSGSSSLLDDAIPVLLDFPSLFDLSGGLAKSITVQQSPRPTRPRMDPDMPLTDFCENLPSQENRPLIQEPLPGGFHTTTYQQTPRKVANTKKTTTSVHLPLPTPPSAPRKKALEDPNHVFLSQTESMLQNALEFARGHLGELVVCATFGRIFVSNVAKKLIQTENKDTDHFVDFLSRTLNDSTVFNYFTKIVTRVPQDVQYMIDLKESDERLWQSEVFDWSVMYCFHFVLKESQQTFIIEIQADTLQHDVKSSERDFGSTNVHGIGRQWDFVIGITGFPKQKDHYHDLVDAIKSSLTVP